MIQPGFAPLAAALILAGSTDARADVTPAAGNQSLGTQVITPTNCSTTCVLEITGGTRTGLNLFHRFQTFDTRPTSGSPNPPITGVTFQNGLSSDAASNVIVGVLSPSHISVPISMQTPASLFWLSPGGITITGTGSFTNIPHLTLSTATGLMFTSDVAGSQTFDAVQTDLNTATGLSGSPVTGTAGLVTNPLSLSGLSPALNNNGDIILQGGLLTVDQSLLVNAQGGNVLLNDAQINAPPDPTNSSSSTPRPGGEVILSGASVGGNALIDTSATLGGITISGGDAQTSGSAGVRLLNGTNLKSGTGSINVTGALPNATNSTGPALELSGVVIETTSGGVSLQGDGGIERPGLDILNASQVSTGTGAITLEGSGGGGGIRISGSTISSESGSLTATGVGGANTGLTAPDGIVLETDNLDNANSLATSGALSLSSDSNGMVIAGSIQGGSDILLRSTDGIRLSSGTQISATGNGTPLVVVAGSGPFVNEAGSTALLVNGGGAWQIYVDTPAGTTLGGLPISFKQYGRAFGDDLPIMGSSTENGILYGISPIISVSLANISKVYDGTGNAIIGSDNLQVSGALDGDVAIVNAAGSYITAGTSPVINAGPEDVGTGKTVVAQASLVSVSSSSAQGTIPVYGYQLNQESSTLSTSSGSITPAQLTLSGLVALNKTYDATTNAVVNGTPTVTAPSRDIVSVAGTPTGSFADRNVGIGKPVTVSGLTLTGADAGNYSLVLTGGLTADITPLALTAGFTAADKVYDGSTAALISTRTLTGAINGDAVTLSGGNAFFADRNVGSAKSVSASGFSLTGADAANYSLSDTSPQAFANITPLALTAGFTAADKVYDGSTAALISTRTLTGAINGDAVTLSGGNAFFADRNVGSAKSVSASGFSLTGADAANYSLSDTSPQAFANITVRPLSTWQASRGGNWSDAANWDALPDGDNVTAVLIPTGSGPVVFDTAVGPTNLQSLTNQGSLALNAAGLTAGQLFNSGSLTLSTDLNLRGLSGQNTFTQTGGSLVGPANLNILNGFSSWSGGSWSGGGQVVLRPGASLTIEGASSQWAGRSLVVQAASDGSATAALTITGTTTAVTGSNTIDNRGLTLLNEATLSSSGGTLQLSNSGRLISSGSTRMDAELINSRGNVQVTSGSLLLNGDGRDSGGSAQVDDGAELIWSSGNRTLLGGTHYSSSGSGSFRLAGATLTATDPTPLVFDGQLLVDSGILSGSGSLAINGGYRQSGGQLIGFSSVAIHQPSGLLQISGASRDAASILTAPGGSIELTAPTGSIAVSNTGLDARGITVGGRILFDAASSILIEGVALLTSGSATGGTITIGNANTPPVLTTIRNSDLIADPPTAGGVISIYGQSIVIEGSTLNVFGDSGGSLIAGNTQTSQLSIDSATRIIAGPRASITCSTLSACAPPPTPTPTPVDQALANEGAAVVLNQSVSQSPLSNDAQTSSQVQQPPLPLDVAIGGGSVERNPLAVSLDQTSSLSMVQGRTQSISASAATPHLGVRTVSTVSTAETREDFNSGTAWSQQETARALGLPDTDQPPPSIETLQKAMQQITQWIRSRQKNAQENHRRCGGEGQQKCPS